MHEFCTKFEKWIRTKKNTTKVYHLKLVEDSDGLVKIGHGNQYPSIKYFMEELNTNRHALKILGANQKSETITLQFPIPPENAPEEENYITMPPVGRILTPLGKFLF